MLFINRISSTFPCTSLTIIVLFSAGMLQAQTDRVHAIDANRTLALKGHLHPRALRALDQGRADPSMPMDYLSLVFQKSDDQKTQLQRLLAAQQDPSSPDFHKWITPEQYADRFGMSSHDISAATSWLRSQGLTVKSIARSRNRIVVGGTVQQVESAFRTEIHHYLEDGKPHFANATEPSVPEALAPAVMGVLGLDDFAFEAPRHVKRTFGPASGSAKPRASAPDGSHSLAPDDIATIYDLMPLYNAGYDGTGQRIVVLGQSTVDINDIRMFRDALLLPKNDPQLLLVPGAANPGPTDSEFEGDADLEWTGAVARNANIIFVYAANAIAQSLPYAIDQNLAPIITLSFGNCETVLALIQILSTEELAQQANVQGITWINSSGDSGAAACDSAFANAIATQGLAASFPASLPGVTGVGGTQFNEGKGNYWNATNSASLGSALSYIPEMGWNESGSGGLASSGGGISTLFTQPSWQTGPGIVTQTGRTVPDIALSAALHDGYLAVGLSGLYVTAEGTSLAAPVFAGMLALISQYQQSNGIATLQGMGNINPMLYQLAQTTPTAFHDITAGNNSVPCITRTFGCTAGSEGYSAGPGYDLVTGLGSVDAFNLAVGITAIWKVPTLTLIDPSTVMAGASDFTMVLNGTGFDTSTTVQWNGTNLPIALATSAGSNGVDLFQPIPTNLVSAAGTATVAVHNSHGTSTSMPLTIVKSTGMTWNSQRMSAAVPPAAGCAIPTAVTSFPTTTQIYLYFLATIGSPDFVTQDWLAPNGQIVDGTQWGTGRGTFCFDSEPLGPLALTQAGTWQARVYDNGNLIFVVPFTVTAAAVTNALVAHLAAGDTWTSGIFAINRGTTAAKYSIAFYDDQGNPAVLPFSSGGTNILSGTLQAGASAYLEAGDPRVQLHSGWGQITADASVAVQALFRNNAGGTYYEAAVPSNTGGNEFLLPFDATNFATNVPLFTGFAIANPNPTPATATCTARDATGKVIPNAISIPQIAGLGHWANYLFPALTGLRGTIDCKSTSSLAATAFRFIGNNAFSSLPVVSLPAPAATTARIAHFAAGDTWTTGVFVMNTGNATANFSVAFFDDNGNPIAVPFSGGATKVLSGSIPAQGSAYFEASDPGGALQAGWAQITADSTIVIQALFRNSVDGTNYEAAVPSTSGGTEFLIPFDATTFAATSDPFYTGFAIANPNKSAANVTCTAKNASGVVIPSAISVPSIPAMGHWANYLFPALAGLRGTIDCVSTSNVAATAFRFIGSDAFSSLPVIIVH